MAVVAGQRHFVALGVVQLAVEEIVAFVQGGDVLVAQGPLAGGDEHRLLVGVAGGEVVERQVEQDRHDRRGTDAGMEDGGEPTGEVIVEGRRGDRDHTEADRSGDDDQVHVVAVVHLRQGADAAGGDRAEQHDAGAAEHGGGHRGDHPAHHRQQAEDHQEQPTGGDHVAALDPGHRHQTDVLGEGALGEGAEDRRQHAGEHVRAQAVAQAPRVDLGVDDLAYREDVRRGFHQGHHDHDAHRDDRGDLEGRHAEVERRGKRHQRAFGDLGEVGHAEEHRDDGADDHRQEDRQARDRGAAELAQQQHDDQGDRRQADVGHAAEVRRVAVAAHRPARGDRHQGQADGGDDDAGHQRREEFGDAREDRRDQQPDQRGRHHRAEHCGNAAAATAADDRHHGRHASEGHPLDQRQLTAEERNAEGLQQGRQAAGEQRSGNQQADVAGREAGGLAEDQGDRDDTAIHGQHMLQAVGHVGADTEVLVFRPWNGWGSGGRRFHGALFSLLLLCAHCRQFDPKISRQMYTKFPTNL